jgi:hypothetical protein
MKTKMILLGLAVFFGSALVAVAQDPNMGTWKLNESKSHFAKGATKNHTVVYEMAGDDIKVTVDGTDASGNAVHNEWTGKFDGKYYAVSGDPTSDMRMYRRVNKRTLAIRGKKDGKSTLSGTITVSRNGKTRTVTTSGRNAQGRWVTNTAVYDKQ